MTELHAAPLDPAGIEPALRPFGASRTLPAAAYTDPAVLAWERRHLFAGAWTCVGRADELARDCTHRAVTVGDVGVLLTFGPEPKAFANVCRHRGHELLGDGTAADRPAAVCPYHGWAFRLDGTLATAPHMAGVASFDPAELGLVELPAAVWHGWLLVNAGRPAPALTEYVGALDGLLAPYDIDNLRLKARHVYAVQANWKAIVENYQECYHCPLIHPELCKVSPPTSGDNWVLPGAWVGGTMDLREHAETMSFDGSGPGVFIEGAPRRTILYVALFPNLLISAHPDYVMTHRLTPQAPDRTEIECSWYFAEGIEDPAYAVDFWDLTNRQDWAACASVQRGLSSPHYVPGPLADNEDAVYQWIALVAAAYLDPAGAIAAQTS
ncbi:aromatic ring-hydroxylating oxygenase subunit alpha [Dactylosporangium matsuzakiense]|uniref:(2Fe-2S)-binding protein n=1 Tax=Dactylosporangium matsuzakiense TaxID=53360 RepID=A0A9W6KQ52_9ACTN|nr:aromatic ring-hydroxylating dioxygenase subunit alpha [Dactylosporangium matsuzakiense]UWZ41919.1 aromatic ring-hydroxylating dioxygenase subunit alpha [Dactylosporangium matsuzakiense]GLL04416.1 (2Fe-2S)-binding protein [Dactylosporangium matsuzakiense]